MDSVAFQH